MMKTKTRLAALSALMLIGCTWESADEVQSKLRTAALKAIEDAKAVDDPWQAHEKLAAAFSEINKPKVCGLARYGESICQKVPDDATAEVRAELERYEDAAIKKGNPDAIVSVFDAGAVYGEKKARLAKLAPDILAAADRLRGTPDDQDALRAAGLIASQGTVSVRNTTRAIGYFARAWAAGNADAANDVANVYSAINDYRNAYLWSLRCVNPCRRTGTNVELDDLQEKLNPAAAKQIEALASDPSVIALDTQSEGKR